MQYTTTQLRKLWLDFWAEKNHALIESSSVVPENDPSALFINSGMHPLVPFFDGMPHPSGRRLANSQKCIRTVDIEEVGDATHLTFFEMLGNWSLGEYFKKEQIAWSYEFLIDVLKLPKEKIAVSVFAGDDDAPRDTEAAQMWMDSGMPENRIAYLGKEDNWWAKGDTGPCGTDTEMFYWTGEEAAPESHQDTHDDERWVEIWNDVFMEFNRKEDQSLEPLAQKNIDTGMGLERTVAVLNGKTSVYETDAFTDILSAISTMANNPDLANNPTADTPEHNSARIIADHVRSSVVLISDGITPSNVAQGYILRRIIRRAVRHGKKIGITDNLCVSIAAHAIKKLKDVYTNIGEQEQTILSVLAAEEEQFSKTLIKGEKEFEKASETVTGNILPGDVAFNLYETYGFPVEMTEELAAERGMKIDMAGYEAAKKAHQEKSREGAAQKFSGGLANHDEKTVKLHTATHLMHAALRKVLGEHVQQKGSNITEKRLRFDFVHSEKMTPEQKEAVEQYVNEAIASSTPIDFCEMNTDDAFASGALGFFRDKYGDEVKVYTMGEWSKEICGGPHAANTGDLGTFKIKKEESCGKGVRRIKALLIAKND